MSLDGLWLGHIRGTNVGLATLRLKQQGSNLSGEIILEDTQFGRTAAEVEGTVSDGGLMCTLRNFQGPPHIPIADSGVIRGQTNGADTQISGTWETNTGSRGFLTFDKESEYPNYIAPGIPPPQQLRPATHPTPAPTIVDFKNVPIPPVSMPVTDLKDLIPILSHAATQAKAHEERLIGNRELIPAERTRQLASIPSPYIDMMGTDGKWLRFPDLESFDPQLVPQNLKHIYFNTYSPGGYMPEHGFQVKLDNVNGSDSANPVGMISVHGSDRTWVEGSFASVNAFFNARKSRRAWLHKVITSQLILWFLVVPLALWVLFRSTDILPNKIQDNAVLNFGIFLYVYLSLYYLFDKFLLLWRWTLPYYEIQFPTRALRQALRITMWVVFLGVIAAFIYDVLKYSVGLGSP